MWKTLVTLNNLGNFRVKGSPREALDTQGVKFCEKISNFTNYEHVFIGTKLC